MGWATDPVVFDQLGAVAQWSEQGTHNPLVVGSIPTGPTRFHSPPGEVDPIQWDHA